jgi:hypothetical protein
MSEAPSNRTSGEEHGQHGPCSEDQQWLAGGRPTAVQAERAIGAFGLEPEPARAHEVGHRCAGSQLDPTANVLREGGRDLPEDDQDDDWHAR